MGELSSLSQQYQRASAFADELNRAALAVKRAGLGARDEAPPAQRRLLADMLDALAVTIATSGSNVSWPADMSPPARLLSVVEAWASDAPEYFVEDLRNLATRVRAGHPLEPQQRELLDRLVSAANGEAAEVFRRLLRS